MWLWGSLTTSGELPHGVLHARDTVFPLRSLAQGSLFGARLEELRARDVLLCTDGQLASAVALLELDGVARRVVLCPPEVAPEHLPQVMREAAVDACVADTTMAERIRGAAPALKVSIPADARLDTMQAPVRRQSQSTEWVLLTSGTSGIPKLVRHTCASLTHAFVDESPSPRGTLWSTFYDIRRYGGLQVFLRALRSDGLVLSDADESVERFLARVASAGVNRISGTPSHWRRALMSGAAAAITPSYVRLSGEIADQAILDALHAAYPAARIEHAFASTEAGVAFSVADGLAGFPESVPTAVAPKAELKVEGGTLHIRGAGTALDYLGAGAPALRAADGFVDTGDRVELRAARYHFMGRVGGVINVGGLKVYPEEVEAVINSHPRVRMSLVRARRSPITGAVVTAEVVLDQEGAAGGVPDADGMIARQLLELCRGALAAHKVPVAIRILPALAVSASGKLVRPDA